MSVVKSLLIVSKCYEIVQLNSIRTLPDLISLISFIVLPFTQLWASSNIILSSILLASSTSIPEKRTEPLFIRDLNIIRILWVNRIFPFDIALPIPPDRFQMNASRVVLHFHFLTDNILFQASASAQKSSVHGVNCHMYQSQVHTISTY